MDIWGMSFAFALICAVLTGILTLTSPSSSKNVLLALPIAGIVMFITAWLSIALLNPPFTYFPDGGYFFGIIALLIIAGVTAASCAGYSYEQENAPFYPLVIAGVVLTLFVLARGISGMTTNPPGFASDDGMKQVYGLLHLTNAQPGQVAPDLDINVAQRVSPSHATAKAKSALPSDKNLGSFLTIGDPYLQGIRLNGATTPHPYYVFSLTVTDWQAYQREGGVIPGYILVDASNVDAPAQWIQLKPENTIRYVQHAGGLFSDLDLDRYAYFNYALPHQVRLDELDGMEVDDSLTPWYTAAIMKPAAGYDYYYPTGMIIINPHTGEIKEYNLDQIPDWVDRRLPIATADQLVGTWARFSGHHIVFPFDSNLGVKKTDDESEVWSPEGLLLQYVMTSVGNDTVATDLIYVNPKTLTAVRYDTQGVIQSNVKATMETAAHNYFKNDMDISILQIEWIAGVQVWYGVVEKNNQYYGVSLVQVSKAQAADASSYIIDRDLQSAVQKLRVQIATGAAPGQGGTISSTSSVIQLDGTIDRIGGNTVESDGTTWRGNFTLKTTYQGQQVSLLCRYALSGDDIQTIMSGAFLHEGDQVTVTLLSVEADTVNDVISIVDHTYPISITASPAPAPVPSASPAPSN